MTATFDHAPLRIPMQLEGDRALGLLFKSDTLILGGGLYVPAADGATLQQAWHIADLKQSLAEVVAMCTGQANAACAAYQVDPFVVTAVRGSLEHTHARVAAKLGQALNEKQGALDAVKAMTQALSAVS